MKKKILFERSAGGIVFKKEDGKTFIALVAPKENTWTFPKGLIEGDKTPQETALKEVKEEAGIEARIVDEAGKQQYWYVMEEIKRRKTVYYYLMEYISGDVKDHDWEVKDAKWVPLEEVENLLVYKGDKQIFKAILPKLL